MALSMKQIREFIDIDEPNYSAMAAVLGKEDIPNLEELVMGGEPMLASKATYAITLIDDAAVVPALDRAAASPRETVRIAAAAGLSNLSGFDVKAVILRLLADGVISVRKSAIKSAQSLRIEAVRPKLEALSNTDPEPGIRAMAKNALKI